MALLRVRSGLTPTLSPAPTCWSPENRAAGGERMEQPGMGAELPVMEWDGECSNRKRTKEGGCEKEKEANPSSGCWREWESNVVTVRHSTTNY